MKLGRPVQPVPQDIANEVIKWIANGKTLRDFCRQENMPSFVTIYDWLAKDREFAERFAQARESGHDVIAEECLAIADDGENDWLQTKRGKRVDKECVERSKLRVDTRLKLLAKWNPKKYGDKMELSGTINTVVVAPSPQESPQIIDARARQLPEPEFED